MALRLSDCARDWAVVTGASSGIGREFAVRLAALGLNVVLVARRGAVLRELAHQLSTAHGVRVQAVELDLALPDAAQALWSRIDELEDCRVRIVINNAACGLWGAFDAAATAIGCDDIVRLNCLAVAAISAAAVPALKRNAPSALINVSSQAAYQPVPYMAAYAATKAFVHSFSQALYEELRPADVLVQTLVPAPTETDFDRRAGAYESAVVHRGSAADVVTKSLAGLERGDAVVTNASGLWRQRLFAALFRPEFVVRQVAKMFRPPAT